MEIHLTLICLLRQDIICWEKQFMCLSTNGLKIGWWEERQKYFSLITWKCFHFESFIGNLFIRLVSAAKLFNLFLSLPIHIVYLLLSLQSYQDSGEKVEFSGPLLSQMHTVDELLERHERHIRRTARRSWFQKGITGIKRSNYLCHFLILYVFPTLIGW